MSGVCWLLIGDGRDAYHRVSRASLSDKVPPADHVVEIDDRDHNLGFAGAIREGWRQVLETDAQFVWHHELDFTYNQPVPVAAMIDVLDAHPHLTQLALLRQPWNDEEKAAGSIYNLIRDWLHPATDGMHHWLEHQRPNTTNPSLWPRWVIERGWPTCQHSEGIFGGDLLKSDPALRSAYWGQGEELCVHIGDERTGHGY